MNDQPEKTSVFVGFFSYCTYSYCEWESKCYPDASCCPKRCEECDSDTDVMEYRKYQ
jgi:hypothetical protein